MIAQWSTVLAVSKGNVVGGRRLIRGNYMFLGIRWFRQYVLLFGITLVAIDVVTDTVNFGGPVMEEDNEFREFEIGIEFNYMV